MASRIESFTGDFAFLSNFFAAEVELDGMLYPTLEHAYQAAKTLDRSEREAIRRLDSPGKAKRAGLKVTLRHDWESKKLGQMRSLLWTSSNGMGICGNGSWPPATPR